MRVCVCECVSQMVSDCASMNANDNGCLRKVWGEGGRGVVHSYRPSKFLLFQLVCVHFPSPIFFFFLFFFYFYLFVIPHDIYRFYCMVIKLAVDFHQTL